ncbi:hypothetical protein JIR001_16350 [Polycladomyces abyssicola]|uniref:Uncharacterized protein n=1 Tax=Polycladomyces abyssicola TaxID=1125966 RepID=A0A8D5UEI7_9BACL|nr:hypothetical protein JIR001_16350 [Polycladomyces abyssicola]
MDSSLKQGIFDHYGQHLLNDTSPVQFYLGFYDGQPAVTTALYYNDIVVGVYDVATLPLMRKRAGEFHVTIFTRSVVESRI